MRPHFLLWIGYVTSEVVVLLILPCIQDGYAPPPKTSRPSGESLSALGTNEHGLRPSTMRMIPDLSLSPAPAKGAVSKWGPFRRRRIWNPVNLPILQGFRGRNGHGIPNGVPNGNGPLESQFGKVVSGRRVSPSSLTRLPFQGRPSAAFRGVRSGTRRGGFLRRDSRVFRRCRRRLGLRDGWL